MSSNDTLLTLEDLQISAFFWTPSFELYNSVAGLYDLGPNGSAIERALLEKWREHFVLEDDMLEVRCTALTPRPVLDASGHTSKFSDYMLTDLVNSQLYRADQYIEKFLESKMHKATDAALKEELHHVIPKVGDYNREELIACMEKYNVVSPEGNKLSTPEAFNLMFGTRIGPGARSVESYLRPETAQGIFVNFPRLFNANRQSLPFAAAQIGVAYRNEISPRNGLIRCREFQMAEIEHFADPERLDDFEKFESVADVVISFFPASAQEKDLPAFSMTLGEAFEKKVIPHKTIGYYIGRVYQFLVAVGLNPEKIRFRQHRANEKAHYSRDCWDAEVLNSITGWLECVGIADRQSFDLTQHSKFTAKKGEDINTQLVVTTKLDTPIKSHRLAIVPEKGAVGKAFRKDAGEVVQALANLPENEIRAILELIAQGEALLGGKPTKQEFAAKFAQLSQEQKDLFKSYTSINVNGKVVTYEMYSVVDEDYEITTRSFIPCVIEPSMGIGRIMTVLLDHSFYLRPQNRRVLRLKPFMAPIKCIVLPVGAKLIPPKMIEDIRKKLRKFGISNQVDASGASIGKRYSRFDEIGTPFGITLDDVSLQDGSVTLRERDSMEQVRGNTDEIIKAIVNMVNGDEKWEDIKQRFQVITSAPTE